MIFYLKVLKEKGIIRKGKLEFAEKNKSDKKSMIVELDQKMEKELELHVRQIENLISGEEIPPVLQVAKCKKCAYYEYCYI